MAQDIEASSIDLDEEEFSIEGFNEVFSEEVDDSPSQKTKPTLESKDKKKPKGSDLKQPDDEPEQDGSEANRSEPEDMDDLDGGDEGDAHSVAQQPQGEKDTSPIAMHMSTYSDRAIQRGVGGNAFLRGRLYARRGYVLGLGTDGDTCTGKVQVKPETFYEPKIFLNDGLLNSHCVCPGWRGPTGHCKHSAALMVALRDRERVFLPKKEESLIPTTVSVGGKKKKHKRKRNSGTEISQEYALPLMRDSQPPAEGHVSRDSLAPKEGTLSRSVVGVWIPEGMDEQLLALEFRMLPRATSIQLTAMLQGTRQAYSIVEALYGTRPIANNMRPLLRILARHVQRTSPATAELKGEDAAEMLSALKGKKVILEPAALELKFSEDVLKPKMDLDLSAGNQVRVRIVFETKGGVRKFHLTQGAWFEGTPCWHVDPTEGVARVISDNVSPVWLSRLCRAPAVVCPTEDLPTLLTEFVPKVAMALGTELPDLASVADVEDAMPHFKVHCDGDLVEANMKLFVSYGREEWLVPAAGMPNPLGFLGKNEHSGRLRIVRRDLGKELEAGGVFASLNCGTSEDGEAWQLKGQDAIDFWSKGIATLPKEWDKTVPSDLKEIKIRKGTVSSQMRVSSGVDWLDVAMTFSSEGVAVNEDELRAALSKGRQFVKLNDGTFAPINQNEVREVLDRLSELATKDGKKLSLSQAGRVQDLLGMIKEVSLNGTAKEMFSKLGKVDGVQMVTKPRNLKATMRDYQHLGFSWLVFMHESAMGGVLADDMGLGKTLQAISLLLWAKAKGSRTLNLVVAPTSVVPNWHREIEKFGPSLKAVVWQGPERFEKEKSLKDADVMITSYALLRRDEEFLEKKKFKYVILDEAQHIKNPLSATARTAKKLDSEWRLAMTGTPIENRLSEIWSIMDFASPGVLGNLKNFEERYARPIEKGDAEVMTKLRTIIKPLVLRRTKGEVAPELPEKIEQEMIVPMSEEQEKLYKQMLTQVRKSVMSEVEKQGVAKSQIQILAALTRLRQAACDPRLTKLNGEWSDETSGKLSALRELLSEATAGGHRVLVFSQFVEMLQLIKNALDQDGVRYEYLDGSTKDRQERVDKFNHDTKVQAFLISLKAGGTGLNLTGADTVVHFDPWWNPAVEDQATDRAHRIGQQKVVTVYRLLTKGTVEEKILQLSEKKRELMSNVLSNEGSVLKGLTESDIEALFADED